MTAQEYLEQYRIVSAKVNQLDKLISRMSREIFNGPSEQITAQLSASIGRSENQNYWDANDLIEFKDLLEQQKENKKRLRSFLKNVIMQIESMDDNVDSTILMGKYVNGDAWRDIANSLGYSDSYTRGYRKDIALNHFDMQFSLSFYKVSTNSTYLSTHNTALT